jgi:hypothetical protein
VLHKRIELAARFFFFTRENIDSLAGTALDDETLVAFPLNVCVASRTDAFQMIRAWWNLRHSQ